MLDPGASRQENQGAQLVAPARETPAVRVDAYGQSGDQFQYPYPLSETEFVVAFPARRAEGPVRRLLDAPRRPARAAGFRCGDLLQPARAAGSPARAAAAPEPRRLPRTTGHLLPPGHLRRRGPGGRPARHDQAAPRRRPELSRRRHWRELQSRRVPAPRVEQHTGFDRQRRLGS